MVQYSIGQSNNFSYSKGGSEVGFSVGTLWIAGDVKANWSQGLTNSIHWRKGLNNVWSIKMALQHGKAYGMNFVPTHDLQNNYPEIFQGYDNVNPYFFAYKTNYSSFEFSNLFELTNLAPEVYLKNWNIYLGIGVGLANFKTDLNLRNDNNQIYSDLINKTKFSTENDHNTINGRREILNLLGSIYDNTYETPGPKAEGAFRLGDETNIQAHLLFNFGLARKLNNRINLGVEYNIRFSDNDLLDGFDNTIDSRKSGSDVIHSLNLVVAFNLGKTHNKKPLYWMNPFSNFDSVLKDQQMKFDSLWLDDDNDGVLNRMDNQENSMSNCPVDQFGVTLDSDNDGIVDCIDPNPYLDENNFNSDLNQKLLELSNQIRVLESDDNDSNDLNFNEAYIQKQIQISQLSKPIYFGLNESLLSDDSKKHLLEVAKVLQKYTDVNLYLNGYASLDGPESLNYILSQKRVNQTKAFLVNILNINTSRINTQYFGEQNPVLAKSNSSNSFLNRRVELKLSDK